MADTSKGKTGRKPGQRLPPGVVARGHLTRKAQKKAAEDAAAGTLHVLPPPPPVTYELPAPDERSSPRERLLHAHALASRSLRDEAQSDRSHAATAQHQRGYVEASIAYFDARQARLDAEARAGSSLDAVERIAAMVRGLPPVLRTRLYALLGVS